MSRRLSAHERALWSRVAATIRPFPGVKATPALSQPLTKPVQIAPKPLIPAPRIPPKTPPKPVLAATLDSSWDRKITRGRLTPDRIIDLHDHNLERANHVLSAAIDAAAHTGDRILLVITGKGRPDRPARIRAELTHWLESTRLRPAIAALRPAHPRHGGSGAFYLILRRPK